MNVTKLIGLGTALAVNTPAAFGLQLTIIDLPTNDIIYDKHSGLIYASVPSTAGIGLGNTVTTIDPLFARVGGSVFVGSEPGPLAVADDGSLLYAGLSGAAAVRRVDLATFTAGLQFRLGADRWFGGPYLAEDIEVMPGQPGTVAISRRNMSFSPRHEGVAIFDDGVMRPTTTPGHTGSNVIEFGTSPGTLYGYNNETTEFGFRTMTITASGVETVSTSGAGIDGFGVDIEFENGRIYASNGRVIDAASGQLQGTYRASGLVEADAAMGLVWFLSGFEATAVLETFDLATFVRIGQFAIPGARGMPTDLIRWGDDGLAFRTSESQVFIIDPTPIPVPAAIWMFGAALTGMASSARRRAC